MNQSQSFGSNGEVLIEGGPFTNDLNIYIQPRSENATEIYITSNSSCDSEGFWQPIQSRIPWILKEPNSLNEFWIRFRNSQNQVSECIKASITHDDKAPLVRIENGPESFTRNTQENIKIIAIDDLSGIQAILCKIDNESQLQPCEEHIDLISLQDGLHQLTISAIDRAGNISTPFEIQWTVDTIAPEVRITQRPDSLSNLSRVQIHFEGDDNPNGSGLEMFSCQFNDGKWMACRSPMTYDNIKEGNNFFQVKAIDKAGNGSEPQSAQWKADTTAPSEFEIIGIKGPQDQLIDAYLYSHPTPEVHWSSSERNLTFDISILNPNEVEIPGCRKQSISSFVALNESSCRLSHGQYYFAQVTAKDEASNTLTKKFKFLVDLKGPEILLGQPNFRQTQNEIWIPIIITSVIPLQETTCKVKDMSTNLINSTNCLNLNELYLKLPTGSYQISASGQNKIGVSAISNTLELLVKENICNPLAQGSTQCINGNGWSGDLFYLNKEQQKKPPTLVKQIISIGKEVPLKIHMSHIDIPTRNFTEGFQLSNYSKAMDESGNILTEWFALRLRSYLRLGTAKPGYYQLSLLSDDGSLLMLGDSEINGTKAPLINNDNNHPTKLGCSIREIYLNSNTIEPIQLEYFQGPRTHIALVLLWKYLGQSKSMFNEKSLQEPLCGVSGNDTFYGPAPYNNMTKYKYGELIKKGWQVIPASSFVKINAPK